MAKVIRKENIRVEVEPHMGSYRYSLSTRSIEDIENEMIRDCEEIKSQIQRHVDNLGSVVVSFDSIPTCTLCDMRYEQEEDGHAQGLPMCCGAAQEEWLEETRQAHCVKHDYVYPVDGRCEGCIAEESQ